jgi:hypothetical protein
VSLFQENDRGEGAGSQHQNQPLQIIASEPAREMQNQDHNCDCVKGVKPHNCLRLIRRLPLRINNVLNSDNNTSEPPK